MRLRGFQQERIGFNWPSLTSWVKTLLIYYSIVFVIEIILQLINPSYRIAVAHFLGFDPTRVAATPYIDFYRFVSYLAYPDFEIFNFIMNLLSIYFIGGFLESSISSKRFIGLFLFSAVFAALGYFIFTGFQGTGLLLGPTAACLGLLACAAILYPTLEVIFFIFPLPLWLVAAIIAAINAFSLLSPSAGFAWAHLLGLGGGALFALNLKAVVPLWQKIWPRKWIESRRRNRERKQQNREDADRREMDRILEKIGKEGIGSLSSSEKKFLDRTSQKLRHRS